MNFSVTKLMKVAACFCALASTQAAAQQIGFDKGWSEQRFSMFSSNKYALQRDSVVVRSAGTVSLLWTALPEALWTNRQARWGWSVEQGVPATDLTKKGGDDRSLALYFVFLPQQVAKAAEGKGIRALLDNPQARVLVYVWGGAHAVGQILPSPYLGARGRTVVLQNSVSGSSAESVDLARDHRRAFAEDPQSLVGLAFSSDSDDTDSVVVGRISKLRID